MSDLTNDALNAFLGAWVMDKGRSNNIDGVLTLQGVGWLKRKAMLVATVTLRNTLAENKGSTSHPLKLVTGLTVTGGIPGAMEARVFDWADKHHDDNVFGNVIIRTQLLKAVQNSEGTLRANLRLELSLAQAADEQDAELFLASDAVGSSALAAETGNGSPVYIHDFIRSEVGKWSVEQVWGLELVGSTNFLTRRIVATKDGKYEKALIVYKFDASL
ncbi:hypothetical protein BJY01DRAFT_251629 [Aspergillus pseudoustus]|uniref:Uncharacterized protein n=1 Tax=Aspergillus pseudoustus TaxID=1810923 RepID=A0ABR4JAM8_9EURO